jgi:hypothetical protein
LILRSNYTIVTAYNALKLHKQRGEYENNDVVGGLSFVGRDVRARFQFKILGQLCE